MSVFSTKMASATRAWAIVNKHIPMIKFRKSSAKGQEHAGSIVQPIMKQTTPTKTVVQSTHATIIEDWQLSGKYKRRPISQEEIDFINRGGPQ